LPAAEAALAASTSPAAGAFGEDAVSAPGWGGFAPEGAEAATSPVDARSAPSPASASTDGTSAPGGASACADAPGAGVTSCTLAEAASAASDFDGWSSEWGLAGDDMESGGPFTRRLWRWASVEWASGKARAMSADRSAAVPAPPGEAC